MLNPNNLTAMAALLDEAAGHLRAFMETELAEQRQLRHFLPDELEGSAIMLRDASGVAVVCPINDAPCCRGCAPGTCTPGDLGRCPKCERQSRLNGDCIECGTGGVQTPEGEQ